ncbi:hypothetical protein [Phyllobacterium myrsinacearum]|uniref:Uncharacterized protein n=1 Tax=Phyllobacterium myrsinacearum TaxID=28101 RepID=A0A839EW78_9HYPH|nr:hypothetical protein [Phyllobacterium myrsinacearum]MBA8881774.1 hypothetical protein [Phyllobacterium myrsinacearum]
MLNLLISYFLKVLGREPSIDEITKPITSIVTKLERHAAVQTAKSAKKEKEAADALAASKDHAETSKRAGLLASKYGNIFNV